MMHGGIDGDAGAVLELYECFDAPHAVCLFELAQYVQVRGRARALNTLARANVNTSVRCLAMQMQ